MPLRDAAPLAEWPHRWRGRWIWDHAPETSYWWAPRPGEPHWTHLRRTFDVGAVPATMPVRVTCDSRYVLYVNGRLVGRGPVREEPERLAWDEHDLAPALVRGANVIVALCHYYGVDGPWWYPAAPMGTLGRGSFCLETAPASAIELLTDGSWHAPPAPWLPVAGRTMHAFPPEIVDGRRAPAGLHDPAAPDATWPAAIVVSAGAQGTVLDRPPASPYMDPLRRTIPQLTSRLLQPARTTLRARRVRVKLEDDPAAAWDTLVTDEGGDRIAQGWDLGQMTLAHVRARISAPEGTAPGSVIDIAVGEDANALGLPVLEQRRWVGRYVHGGGAREEITFFDPVGFRVIAAHAPPGFTVEVEAEEAIYPRPDGASFGSSDPRYDELWRVGVRTVELCATDTFLDCPGREQRAWVSDAYVEILAWLVASPDWALVRRHLAVCARSRFPSGLLAGAAACDFSHLAFTIPEYSLYWIRSLAAYWRCSGDEAFVRAHLPVAEGIIDRYERQRGPSGSLEDFPGWVFIDWAQVDRDTVIGAHEGLYATALRDYGSLPGARDVTALIARTAAGFEALWDAERGMYVDCIGDRGKSRRLSQQTNAAALLGGLVPTERVAGLIERTVDPAGAGLGRVVMTLTPGEARRKARLSGGEASITFQYRPPSDFDEERDVVGAQMWFVRYLHEALFRYDRRDLILRDLLRWDPQPEHGTFAEFWTMRPGEASRCHGWSASPTYDLTAYVLGVRPETPGYARAVIDPYLGPLDSAEGRVPTPHGWLDVAVTRERIRATVPSGMTIDAGGVALGAGTHDVAARARETVRS